MDSIQIEINNDYSKVLDITPKVEIILKSALSCKSPGAEFSASYQSGLWDGSTHFFARGKFPTGLLSTALKALKSAEVQYTLVDNRKEVPYNLGESVYLDDSKIGQIVLRDYQYEAVRNSLLASRGIINVATNGGKTEIACGIMKSVLEHLQEGETIGFFTSSKEICMQTKKRIEERLGEEVGIVGMGNWEVKRINIIMISTVSRYLKMPKSITETKTLKKMKEEGNIEQYNKGMAEQKSKLKEQVKNVKNLLNSVVLLIADEVHHASSDSWYKVLMSTPNAYFRFGLTGTVNDSQDEPIGYTRLLGCTGRITCKISNSFLIEKGYSAEPIIYMLHHDTEVNDYLTYQSAKDSMIINNPIRNSVFVEKILAECKQGNQCLVIVNETSHGEILKEMLSCLGDKVQFSHGECTVAHRNTCLEGLKNEFIQVLIATSILDEGVDVSGINCLFLVGGGKSSRVLLQRVGRGLRKKADGSGIKVYDALDLCNKYLARHTMERYNIYKEEKFHIKNM